jgi:hypothetical protein
MSIRQVTGPVPLRQAVADLLALSDERDTWLSRVAAASCDGWDACWPVAFVAGWAAAEDHAEREHQAIAARVLETPQQSVSRRLRAAEAGCRRDAAEHWRRRWAELHRLSRDEKFVREARARDPYRRSYEQTMSLLLRDREQGAA